MNKIGFRGVNKLQLSTAVRGQSYMQSQHVIILTVTTDSKKIFAMLHFRLVTMLFVLQVFNRKVFDKVKFSLMTDDD